MELSEFVEESLAQILQGIINAQKGEYGDNIAAQVYFPSHGNLIGSGSDGAFTSVDFDVSVVAEAKAGGKGSIKVFSVEASGGLERMAQAASRVKFSVHLRLPKGGGPPSEAQAFNRDLSDSYTNSGLA